MKIKRGLGTERARLDTFKALAQNVQDQALLKALAQNVQDQALLEALAQNVQDQALLEGFPKNCHFFTQKEHPSPQKLKFCMTN